MAHAMRTRQIAQIGGPAILVVAVWFGLAWWPSERSLAAAEDRINVAATDRAELLTTLNEVKELRALIPTIERKSKLVETAIPPTVEMASFVEELSTVARGNDVRITSLSPQRIDDGETAPPTIIPPAGVSAISIGISFEAEYEGLLGFLSDVDTLERLALIDSVEIAAGVDEQTLLAVNVELRIFTTAAITPFGARREPGDFSALSDELGIEVPPANQDFDNLRDDAENFLRNRAPGGADD